jgi:enediyne biosynthesis protein E4
MSRRRKTTTPALALGLMGLSLCGFAAPAAAQFFFTDVTEPAIHNRHLGIRLADYYITRMAIGDVDNDGWPDLLGTESFREPSGKYLLLHNESGFRFANHPSAIPPGAMPQSLAGGIFGDYDRDGDLDLFVAVGGVQAGAIGPNRLLRNDLGAFTDLTEAAGLTAISNTENAIWLDYDRDGRLDLYVGNFVFPEGTESLRNRLYRGNGDGTFADVTVVAGLDLQLGAGGGSGQGMVAADFDGDDWPDLYIAVYKEANRLFLNDTRGGFIDASTSAIADLGGEPFGVAVGDIDNDGDLDLFQASGAGPTDDQRSLLFLNLGKGQFIDATESVGLGDVRDRDGQTRGAAFGDIDNDGDLDLLTASPSRLFLNDGGGVFVDETARALSETGLPGNSVIVLGDLDLDGFLDVWRDNNRNGTLGTSLRNNGLPLDEHHWLRVELVGTSSSREGIGARLRATAGDLRQVRQILGGTGLSQDEMVAHFGLGPRARVDELEIRWPSGEVDVLRDIPSDQKIRVIEGSGVYHAVQPTVWESPPPEHVVAGTDLDLRLAVRPALFDAVAEVTQVTADLSGLGGPAAVTLTPSANGVFAAQVPLIVETEAESVPIFVDIEQTTSLGPTRTRTSRSVLVEPRPRLGQTFAEVLTPTGIGGSGKESFPSWGDYDSDGDQDLFLARNDVNSLYRNNGNGTFTDVIDQLGLPLSRWDIGSSWVDYDADGDLDLFVVSAGPDDLYRNTGDGSFVDVAAASGINDSRFGIDAAWADYDLDGDLDVYVGNHSAPNGLFDSAGDGTFTDVAVARGIDGGDGVTFFVSWADYDDDGDADLYLSNQGGDNPNRLYKNGGDGSFIDVTPMELALFGISINGPNKMAWADYDGDGDLDLAVAGAAREFAPEEAAEVKNWLFRNDGNGAFAEVTATAGVDDPGIGFGGFWADYDNDGDLDFLRTNSIEPSRLYRNDGDGTFTDVAEKEGLAFQAEIAAWADWDGDGDQDLFVRPTGGRPETLYTNNTLPRHWLQVALMEENGRRGGLGASVTVVAGGRRQRRDVGTQTYSPLALAFGLGRSSRVDSLLIRWPSGRTSSYSDVEANQLIGLMEGVATAVEGSSGSQPKLFALEQNYPNPFNGGTVIDFTLPARQSVELAVYDLLGQRVASLVDEERPAGTYSIAWSGRDDNRRELASGLYLYRLQSGSRTTTKKLMLLR